MSRAYWVICHRSTKSAEKFAAFTRLAYPAIQAAGGRFLVRSATVAKTYEHGLNDRTVVIEFENLAKAIAAYDTPDYKQALRALGDGAERDLRIVEGVQGVDLELAQLPPLERYKLLIGLVIPRPIAWVSTSSENGVANCAPFSFFNVISEDPPLCILSFNWRSDGEVKHTLKNIRRTGEFVVNLADEGTANAMHLTGTELPETESEFSKYGLTPVPAKLVKHPRIGEAAAALECRVERRIAFGPERELVVGEILLIHARDGIVDPVTKRISEELYRPVGRLFANRYCTTRQRFDLPGALPPGNPPAR